MRNSFKDETYCRERFFNFYRKAAIVSTSKMFKNMLGTLLSKMYYVSYNLEHHQTTFSKLCSFFQHTIFFVFAKIDPRKYDFWYQYEWPQKSKWRIVLKLETSSIRKWAVQFTKHFKFWDIIQNLWWGGLCRLKINILFKFRITESICTLNKYTTNSRYIY